MTTAARIKSSSALFIAILVVAGSTRSPEVSPRPYSLTGAHWPSPLATYRVNANFTDPSAGSAQNQINAIRLAADTWRIESGSPFAFSYGGTTSVATVAADGINAVYYSNTDGGGALAICYWWTQGGITTNYDIVYYDRDGANNFVWATSPTASQFDIQGVAVHEFGHALGLGHSAVLGATMYPSVAPGSLAPRTLDPDDAAGAVALYGSAPPPPPDILSVTPNNGWIDGGMTIQIAGQYFAPSGLVVNVGGVPATSVSLINSQLVSCVVPAGTNGGPTTVSLQDAGGIETVPNAFSYLTVRIENEPLLDQYTYIQSRVPADANLWFQGIASFTAGSFVINSLGNPPDLRVIPIGYDWLIDYSLIDGASSWYFWNIQGFRDATGFARFAFRLPTVPGAHGATVQICCLSGLPGAPTGIQSISNGIGIYFP